MDIAQAILGAAFMLSLAWTTGKTIEGITAKQIRKMELGK